MRDPKRIAGLLQALEETWRTDPDFRLAQIIVGAANLSGRKIICPELFSLEDEDLLSGLAELAKQKRAAKA